MYRTILVPLDGSEFAEHALPTAAQLAVRAKALLLLARVHEPPSHGGATWDEFFRNEELAYLERVRARTAAAHPVDVETTLMVGDVADAIRQCAEQRPECLIAMSTNGRTGLSRAWLGSVADGVVRSSKQPVLMLRPSTSASITSTIDRVLVALDGSSFAEQVVQHAARLALLLSARMTLFRVVERVYAVLPTPIVAHSIMAEEVELMEESKESAQKYLDGLAGGLRSKYPEVDVQTDVRIANSAAQAIVERARDDERELVALATRGRGLSRLVIGSVADKVIRAAGEGVLVIRPADTT